MNYSSGIPWCPVLCLVLCLLAGTGCYLAPKAGVRGSDHAHDGNVTYAPAVSGEMVTNLYAFRGQASAEARYTLGSGRFEYLASYVFRPLRQKNGRGASFSSKIGIAVSTATGGGDMRFDGVVGGVDVFHDNWFIELAGAVEEAIWDISAVRGGVFLGYALRF